MRCLLLLLGTIAAALPAAAQDRPLPPEAAAKAMTLPPGFKATLFAGEPDVVQPIAFTFDDRGRLWVVECLSYPKWSADGTGRDRVTIFEDTNGDGRFDQRTVFFDKGANLSGIEVGFGGVWLCSTPNLVFIPDRDGDDRPDGPPQVLLDGWDLSAKHNVFNGLAWGPDGWLYGCNGILSNSRVGKPGAPPEKRVALNCGVWRYHPTRQVFEAFAHGTTNPWGIDFDEFGELFITNCVIKHLWHVVPGARFQRMFGQDINPNTYVLMPSIADHIHWGGGDWTSSRGGKGVHDAPGGGHAHSGCMVYLGDNWPAEYRGNVFTLNIHGSRVNRDTLHQRRSTYVARHAPDFLLANDPWFRGVAIRYGPDGGVFLSDWSDTGECHNYDRADASNGRIFKVSYGTPKPFAGNLARLSDIELVELQRHRNDWFPRHARRVLQERAAAGRLDPRAIAAARALLEDDLEDARLRLRALWLLHVTGQKDYLRLDDRSESVRRWSVRLLADQPDGLRVGPLRDLLRDKTLLSDAITLELIAAFRNTPPSARADLMLQLALNGDGRGDPYLEPMLWYAVEPLAAQEPRLCAVLIGTSNWPLAGELMARRLTELKPENMELVFEQLTRSPATRGAVGAALRGVLAGLAGRRDAPMPKAWPALARLINNARGADDLKDQALQLAVIFGDARALESLRERVKDANAPTEKRRAAVALLRQKQVPDLFALLGGLLDDKGLRAEAIRGLAALAEPSIPELLLKRYKDLTDAERADAITTLSSRPAFALALLDAVAGGTVPARDITPFAARQILALKDPAVAQRLERVWGVVRPAAAQRDQLMARYRALLTPDALKKTDPARGKLLFAKHCGTCHKLFGEGQSVGPDLTGSQRTNLDYLLENVIDPSAVVPREYTVVVIELKNGRTVSGAIAEETPTAVAVQTQTERLVIPRADIEAQTPTRVSLMPEGLFDRLTAEELRDLVGHLMRK